MKPALLLALKVAVSAGLLWLVLQRVDGLPAIPPPEIAWLAGAAGAALLQFGLIALRWRILLHAIGAPVPVSEAVRQVAAALCVNQAMPSTLGGDAVRLWQLTRLGVPVPRSLGALVLDRLLALAAMLVLVALALPEINGRAGGTLAVPIGLILIAVLGGGLLVGAAGRIGVMRRFPALAARAAPLRQVSWRELAVAFAVTIVSHAQTILIAFAVGRSIGLTLDLGLSFCAVPLVAVLAVVPVSLAGWGIREAGMVAIGPMLGASAADSLLFAIGLGLAQLAQGLTAGAIWAALGLLHRPMGMGVRERAT